MAPDETVAEEVSGTLQDTLEQLRSEIKAVWSTVKFTSDAIKGRDPNIEGEDKGEMIANTILAYRHLEDAAMRLGKALQAMNGGVSIFDKK